MLAPSDIAFEAAPDGSYHVYLHALSYVYDDDGLLINSQDDQGRVDLSTASYQKMLRLGVPIHQEISVPLKGNYFLRVGVHDQLSNRVGAVEIPVDSVKDLSPVTSLSQLPQPAPLRH